MMTRLAGLVTDLPELEARAQVASMLHAMAAGHAHETRFHTAPSLGGYFGWVDSTGGSTRPAFGEASRASVLFAGEHFGDSVDSPSQPTFGVDIPDLIATYRRQGHRCFRELNGWFAGVLVDEEQREVVVFTDRLGMHRLYVHEGPDGVAFASEAKALLAVRPQCREIDPAGLAQVLAVGSTFDERTLFAQVGRMPGGSAWSLRAGHAPRRAQYFSPAELESSTPLDDAAFYEELSSTLSRVVPKYFAGNDVAAVSLTGGFDSRAILAFGDEASPWRLAYTYNGMYRECADVTVARRVAAASGYRHEVLSIDAGFLQRFSDHAEQTVRVTEGTLDISAAHEVFLSQRARPLAPVRITGNYGGEVFRRVTTFKPMRLSSTLVGDGMQQRIDDAVGRFTELKRRHPVSFAVFDEIPSQLWGRAAAAQSQLVLRTPYTDNALIALAYRVPQPARNETDGWHRMLTARSPELAAIPTDRGKLGVDRWSARLERLFGYVMFKAEWYYDGGMPPWLSAVERRLVGTRPPFFVGSHKIQNYRLWFRNQTADYLRGVVDEASTLPYFERERCRNLVDDHQSGRANRVNEIAHVATIALVNRLLLRSASVPSAAPRAELRVS